MLERTVEVMPGGAGAYPVFVGESILARVTAVAEAQSVLVSNDTVFGRYGGTLVAGLERAGKRVETVRVADGEVHKNMETLSRVLDAMAAAGLRRDGGVIALGGGVVGDLAGFAAAVYMRGVGLIQVPTTLLAQVDAAVGGKTGVNHSRGKNLVGAFHQPKAVVCDVRTLDSLPEREYRAGLAEVVKYGLLGDAEFFAMLEGRWREVVARDSAVLVDLIARCVGIKADIVAADERETGGRRALLNLGHTFAHALETVTGYGELLHGEAVAMGLLAAARLSARVGGFAEADVSRLAGLLGRLGLPMRPATAVPVEDLWRAMAMDKKHATDRRRFVLLLRVGEAYVDEGVDASSVREVLEGWQ